MTHEDLIARINQLSAKRKTEGLTPEEEKERKELHQAYLKSFRSSMKSQIEGMKVVDQEGQDITPDKLKEIQKKRRLHERHLDKE